MNPQGMKLDIGWLGESWKVLQSRMGEYIGMVLVAGILGYIISFVIQLPFNILFPTLVDQNVGLAFAALGLQIVVSMLAQGIGYIFYAGIMIFTLKQLRGEQAKFEDLFIAFKNPAPYFVGGLLYGLATAIGVLACCVGSIAIAGLLMFMFPLIHDRKLSGVAAFQESINLLKDQWPMAMAYIFCTALFSIAGIIACGIGVLVTMPIMYIAPALAYHKIVGVPDGVHLSPSQYPRNPGDAANMPAAPSAWPTEAPSSTIDPPQTPSPEPSAPVEGWGDTMGADSNPPTMPDPSATVGEADAVIEDPDADRPKDA